MGFGLILGAVLTGAMTAAFWGNIVAGLIMAGLTLLMGLVSPVPKTNLKPASLADFKFTQANEGQPVPLVYGIVKIPGNIIYYGNLKVEKMEEEGGKGGGSSSVTVGYKYWIDMWQAICVGKIELIKAFLNDDEEKQVKYESQLFNDGTTNTYPTHLEYASRIPNVAHIYWSQFYVGENTTIVPTVYFKVRRILNTPLTYNYVLDRYIDSPKITSTNLEIGGYLATGSYYFKVVAYKNTQNSKVSVEKSKTITSRDYLSGYASISISWDAVSGATSYRVYVGTTSNGQDRYWTTTNTSFLLTKYGTGDGSTQGTPPTTCTWVEEGSSNPAAAVYDLLVNFGGVSVSDINFTSFQDASTYFYQEGLGINYVISSTKKTREVINDILSFVDAYLDYDEDGKITLEILKKSDASIGTIEDDFIEFSFSKPSWNTTPNHFVGNFVEEGVEKTIILENQAGKAYAGYNIREEYDLTVFKERNIAIKRLADIMKRDSYPRIALSLKLPIRYATYSVGDVVTIKNTELGFSGDFRVMSISEPKIDSNEIDMQLIQHTDIKFDNFYQGVGGGLWQPPDYTLQKLMKVKVLELDYNPQLPNTTNFLILVSRETGFEESFMVLVSLDGISYEQVAICSEWATAGTINEQYPNTTYDIDDDVGIIFTPYKEIETKPLSIPRSALFVEPRVLVVNNEIMAFQNYSPYGTDSYKITGIVRNLLWSGKATHNANSTAFHGYIGDNIVSIDLQTTFYIKVVPVFQGQTGDVAQATAITVTPSAKAKSPRTPERLYAIRSGSTVTVDVFIINKTLNTGQGMQNADSYTDTYPFPLEGRLYISTDGTNWEWKDTANFTITNASAFTLRVKHYYNGRYSAEKTLSVGSADGEYVS